MKNVIVGIDAGGTSTEFAIFADGIKIAAHTGEGSNLANNREGAIDTVMEGLKHLITQEMRVEKVVIGMAGIVGNPLVEVLEERIADVYEASCIVYNDVVFAHKAIFKNGPGILLSAGTGSVCVIHDGKTVQYEIIGGYGHLFGDEGSGYDIARRAIVHCTLMHDFAQTDALSEAILKELQFDTIREAIPYLYRAVKGDIARLAKVVSDEAAAGNELAEELLVASAKAYVAHIIAVIKTREIPVTTFGLWGSVFVKNAIVQKTIVESLSSELALEQVSTDGLDISAAALYE